MAVLSEIIDTLDRLAPLPTSVTRAIEELHRPEFDVERLREIIRSDEALTSAVLARSNSAFYNASGRTFDLRESLVRLGSKALLGVILEQKLAGAFDGGGVAYGVRRHAMWLGAVGGAVTAEKLAAEHGLPHPELCFVSAMLRDIGKLAVDAYIAERSGTLPELGANDEKPFLEFEHELFGVDHAELGAMLAKSWSLPEEIIGTIRGHHTPAEPGTDAHSDVTDVVHAADIVCLWAGLGLGNDGLHYRISPHVQSHYLPDRETAERYIAFARERTESIDASLGGDKGACA